MSSLTRLLVVPIVGCLAGTSLAQAAPPPEAEIARWIEQLGDPNFAVRERATNLLWKAGSPAEPALRQALTSRDAEIVRRAREVLEKFKWGIYPDTPPEVLDRIGRYQVGDRNAKLAVVAELINLGVPGCVALVKISTAEDDPALRQQLSQRLSAEAGRAIPVLLAGGDFAALDQLIDLNLGAGTEPALLGYAVYWQFRGKLDERVAQHQTRADKGDAHAAEVLTLLYRVKGDLKAALAAARKSGKADLEEMVLYERGDWKALAAMPPPAAGDIEALSYRAAYARLAGDREQLDRLADEIRRHGEQNSGDDRALFHSAEALLLNGRVREGMDILLKRGDLGPALEILHAQLKFREVVELAEKAQREGKREPFTLEVARARALHAMGEKEPALQAFTNLAARIPTVTQSNVLESLVAAEFRLGLKELAYDHFGRALPRMTVPRNQSRAFALLFPERGEAAEAWWKFLRRKSPQEDPGAALKRVRQLVDGKAAVADLDALVREAEARPATFATPAEAEEYDRRLVAVGEALLAAGKEEQARTLWEKAGEKAATPWPLMRLGDLLAEQKEWDRAAECYEKACAKNRKEPLPLFLRGWALEQAGRKEGRKLMELAHVLPLGDDAARQQFASALTRRGHRDEARREHELAIRLSRPTVFTAGDSQRQLAQEAAARKDYLKAADYHERVMLRILKTTTVYLEGGSYVTSPCLVHRYRALGLLAAGKLDEARKEIALSRAVLPANTDLPILLVPELERLGHKKDAEDLFSEVFTLNEKLCADYPKSAQAHNSLAWLCARCRRRLDQAVEHARKAVELAPEVAGYHETLAEAHFQRGDKAKALEAIGKCIELEPKRVYFQNQKKRIEAGDPAAPLPDAAG